MFDPEIEDKDSIDIIAILRNIPEFSLLDTEHLQKIATVVNLKELKPGYVVFRENDIGDAFYIILSGEVEIFVTNEEKVEVTLLKLNAMDSFGEIGFITGKPRAASSKIVIDSKILVIRKNDFDSVMENDPFLTKTFINILGHRLKTDNERAIEQSNKKHELRQFWVESSTCEPIKLVGRSKHIIQLKEFSLKAAENNLPTLLIGEKGTGKLARAQFIFENSKRRGERYLTVDCSAIRQISTPEGGDDNKSNEVLLSLSQESTLFGHLQGALPFAKTRRLGYIEVAEGGTIVIDNVEKLTVEVQKRLLAYLKTGFFSRLGSDEQIKSNTKLILTCEANIDELVNDGLFDKELYNLLTRQSMLLLPLRERQKDIHDLVDHFIEEFSKLECKNITGIAKEAMNLLLGYDWPNNMDQLKGVIRRAISMADGDKIKASDIFIGPIVTEKARGLNLLRFDPVRKFIESRFFPNPIRYIIAVVFSLMILLLLFGFYGYEKNAVLLIWAVSWPMMLIGVIFASRLFCGLCPMRTIAEKIQEKIGIKLKLPNFIKKKGPYIAVFGFAVILSVEHIVDMPYEPLVTAGLFLSILGFAMIFSFLYDRAVWCRYLCPLGQMNGVYSKLSIFEVRANTSVCNSECRTPTCYNGTEDSKGCPMYLGVFNMYTNENCLMCGQCIKNCKHRSVRLNLRFPAAELFRDYGIDSYRKGTNLAITFFIPLLIAGVLSMNFTKLFIINNISLGINNEVIKYIFFYLLFYGLSTGLIWFGSTLIKAGKQAESMEMFVRFACSFIPLAFAGEIANQVITFINGFGQIVPLVNLQIGGYTLNILSHQESTWSVKLLQVILIMIGTTVSIYFGKRVVRKVSQKNSHKEFWPVYLINAIFSILLIAVFILR